MFVKVGEGLKSARSRGSGWLVEVKLITGEGKIVG
jgi:hypothetical protein